VDWVGEGCRCSVWVEVGWGVEEREGSLQCCAGLLGGLEGKLLPRKVALLLFSVVRNSKRGARVVSVAGSVTVPRMQDSSASAQRSSNSCGSWYAKR